MNVVVAIVSVGYLFQRALCVIREKELLLKRNLDGYVVYRVKCAVIAVCKPLLVAVYVGDTGYLTVCTESIFDSVLAFDTV